MCLVCVNVYLVWFCFCYMLKRYRLFIALCSFITYVIDFVNIKNNLFVEEFM